MKKIVWCPDADGTTYWLTIDGVTLGSYNSITKSVTSLDRTRKIITGNNYQLVVGLDLCNILKQ